MESVGWNSSLRFKRMRKNLQETLVLLDSAPCGTGARVGVLVGERADRLCSCLSGTQDLRDLFSSSAYLRSSFLFLSSHLFLPPSLPHSFPFCSRKARYLAQAKPSLQKVALGKACPRTQGGSVLGFVPAGKTSAAHCQCCPSSTGLPWPIHGLALTPLCHLHALIFHSWGTA